MLGQLESAYAQQAYLPHPQPHPPTHHPAYLPTPPHHPMFHPDPFATLHDPSAAAAAMVWSGGQHTPPTTTTTSMYPSYVNQMSPHGAFFRYRDIDR